MHSLFSWRFVSIVCLVALRCTDLLSGATASASRDKAGSCGNRSEEDIVWSCGKVQRPLPLKVARNTWSATFELLLFWRCRTAYDQCELVSYAALTYQIFVKSTGLGIQLHISTMTSGVHLLP